MVHYGKHIIDEETGLCEICDRGAIHDYRQGKRPGRQFLYSNQDGKFTYRPNDGGDGDEVRDDHDENTPRYVRKPLYPEPPPQKTRPVVREEPQVQKKSPRRKPSPVDDIQRSSPHRPTTFYYVDGSGQMLPQNEGPSDEPHRRYIVQEQHSARTNRSNRDVVQNHHSPRKDHPTREVVQNHPSPRKNHPTHDVRRRAQTPPPRPSKTWHSPSKRQNNSTEDIVRETHRARTNHGYYDDSPRKAEMYHIVGDDHDNHLSTISSRVQRGGDHNHYQGDPHRKQRRLEPIERKHYTEPEPTVIRKVYKKLPAKRQEYRDEQHVPNENHERVVRKVEKLYPKPRTYDSAPNLAKTFVRDPVSDRATVYYLENGRRYQQQKF